MDSTSWWPRSDGPRPRHATRRNPALRSDGPQIEAVARALGTPLTPWQRYVADVAGERRPDGSYEHQVVVVSVPRQSGKTALIRAVGVHRAMLGRGVFYTAQTGKDARARWADLVKVLRLSAAFKGKVKSGEIGVFLRGGSEHVAFPGGGVFQAFAPTIESLHGYTPATVFVDEAFAQAQENGDLLVDGAIIPAQRIVIDKQVWIVSTMGTSEATWFHGWLDAAITGAPRVAVFDWGARDDQDPFDLDDIANFHPAIGQTYVEIGATEGVTTTAADILAEASKMKNTAEYVRAYGNRRTVTAGNLIPPETWSGLVPEDFELTPPENTRDVTLAYDVDEHQAGAAILAVWHDSVTGKPAVKVVRSEPGATWLVPAVAALDQEWRPDRVVAVGNGPVLDITQQLRDRGVDVDELSEREFAAATTATLAAISTGDLVHDGHPVLAAAMTGLVTRTAVVDGVAFSRRHSVGLSSAAIAATAGLYRHRHAPEAAPVVRFG